MAGSSVGPGVGPGGSAEMVGELVAGLGNGLGCSPWGGESVAHPAIMVRATTKAAELAIN